MGHTSIIVEAGSRAGAAAPAELAALVRGSRQARWLLALQSPEGLHHSEGKHGRYSGSLHDDIARFVHRCRSAGWEVRVSRLARGTDRYFLDVADRDLARGEAYAALGEAAPADLIAELRADAALRARTADLAGSVRRNCWRELEPGELVDVARRLNAEQIEVLTVLIANAEVDLDELAEVAVALAPAG